MILIFIFNVRFFVKYDIDYRNVLKILFANYLTSNVVIAGLIFLFQYSLNAQVLLNSVETSNYPNITSEFYFTANDDISVQDLEKADIDLLQNSDPLGFSLIEPGPYDQRATSVVFSVDISSSMNGFKMDIVRSAMLKWKILSDPNYNETALCTFNEKAFINQDFTDNADDIISAFQNIATSGNANFKNAFSDQAAGAINIAAAGKWDKSIILITDGIVETDISDIVILADNYGIKVFPVVLAGPAGKTLSDLALKTGGSFYDNITDPGSLEDAFKKIYFAVSGIPPYKILWESNGCQTHRNLSFRINYLGEDFFSSFDYEINQRYLSKLQYSSSTSINFGAVDPGIILDTIIKLFSGREPISINSYTSTNQDISIPILDQETINIPPGDSAEIEIFFQISTNTLGFGRIEFDTDACLEKTLYIAANIRGTTPADTLKVVFPNGGEKLVSGSDTTIKWEGILPENEVIIEYSTNDGANWIKADEGAIGLEYSWKVPDLPTNEGLMRIRKTDSKDSKVTILSGHENSVYGISWKPDSRKIVSGSNDGWIIVWDLINNNIDTIVSNSEGLVASVLWSRDGKKIITTRNEMIRVWNAETYSHERDYAGHESNILDIEISPDNRYLAGGDYGGELILRNADNFNQVKSVSAHNAALSSIAWSTASDRLLTVSWDNKFKVFSVPGLDEEFSSINQEFEIYSVSSSPDDKYAAISGRSGKIIIYDLRNYSPADTLETGADKVPVVSWSPDGAYIACGTSNESVIIFDGINFEKIYEFTGHTEEVKTLRWNRNGTKLASGSLDSYIEIWSPYDIPLEEPDILSDESDNIWQIVSPKLKSLDVDFGQILVSTFRDSTVRNFIYNNGSVPIRIDSISISNTDNFKLVSGFVPLIMKPGEIKSLIFRVTAGTDIGKISSDILIHHQNGMLPQTLEAQVVSPIISIINQDVDFGKVSLGTKADTTIVLIYNETGFPVTITGTELINYRGTPFRMEPKPDIFNIGSKKSAEFKIIFEPEYPGKVSGLINFYFDGNGSPARVRLLGKGIDYQLDVPELLQYPAQICNSTPHDSLIVLKNLGSEPVTIKSISITDDNFGSFEILDPEPFEEFDIAAGTTGEIAIRFAPGNAGNFTAKLIIESSFTGDVSKSSQVLLSGSFQMYKFEVSKNHIDLGTIDIGSSSRDSMIIYNKGTMPVTFEDIISPDEHLIISHQIPLNIQPNDSAYINFLYSGKKSGHDLNVHFELKDSCNNQEIITITGKTKQNESILTSIDEIVLPDAVCPPYSMDTTIVITNTGSSRLLIDSLKLNGDDDEEFELLNIIDDVLIEPSATLEIEIRFVPEPQKTGLRNAELIIFSNAVNADNSRNLITLTAKTEHISYFVSTNTVDLGIAEINTQTSSTFEITNTGTRNISWETPLIKDGFYIEISPEQTIPGNKSTATVNFESATPGIFTSSIEIYDQCGNIENIILTTNIEPVKSAKIILEDFCGYPDDSVQVKIRLSDTTNFEYSDFKYISADLTMPAGILRPINETPAGSIIDDEMIIEDILLSRIPDDSGYAAVFDFVVLRSFRDISTIELTTPKPDIGTIVFTIENGEFELACGNPIRYTANSCSAVTLFQNFPNPASKTTTIEYILREDAEIELILYNVRSEKVLTIDKGFRPKGEYSVSFNPAGLPIGIYIYHLKTNLGFENCKMIRGKMEIYK